MFRHDFAQPLATSRQGTSTARLLQGADARILIVDDDREASRRLAAMLTTGGFDDIRTVRSAARALTLAAAFLPHLVFLDTALPDVDAYELSRQIAKCLQQKPVRLIGLTRSGETAGREVARFERFLSKPVAQVDLDRIVGRPAS